VIGSSVGYRSRLTRDGRLAEEVAQKALPAALEPVAANRRPRKRRRMAHRHRQKRRAIDLFRRNAVAERKLAITQ
jgi:predicted RNA polymerase sigma factor